MDQFLTCKYNNCNKYFLKQITLPCGDTICQEHTQQHTNGQFKCQLCKITHRLPENGFAINQVLVGILKY